MRCYHERRDAGWSSQVARRAHNPEVAGSNPAPAIPIAPLRGAVLEASAQARARKLRDFDPVLDGVPGDRGRERDQHPEPDEEVDDREDSREVAGRGEVAVAHDSDPAPASSRGAWDARATGARLGIGSPQARPVRWVGQAVRLNATSNLSTDALCPGVSPGSMASRVASPLR